MRTLEKRIYSLKSVELRTEGENMVVAGYASVFNSDSLDLGGFTEQVSPTAFNRTLQENPDVFALWNHNMDEPLGRTASGTLKLAVDDRGLKVELSLPTTGRGPYVAELIKRGDVSGMSIGFSTMSDKWEMVDGKKKRTLIDVNLYEVSPVVIPAYPDTSIAMRSMEQAFAKPSSPEKSQEELNGIYETLKRSIDVITI